MDRYFKPVLLKDMGEVFHIVFSAAIQIFGTEIKFGVDSILGGKINPVNEHGIGDIDMDQGHHRAL
jgi:hypothetical protein